MSTCPNCGAETSGESYCSRCGSVLESSEQASRDVDGTNLYTLGSNGPKFETFGDENPPCPKSVAEAYARCLQCFSKFEGRACRKEYWSFLSINLLVVAVLWGFGCVRWSFDFLFLAIVYSILVALPSFAVAVRRRHDFSASGWICSLGLAPFIMIAVLWNRLEEELTRVDQARELFNYWEPSAWFALVLFATFALFVYIGVRRGVPEPNRYGTPPERR